MEGVLMASVAVGMTVADMGRSRLGTWRPDDVTHRLDAVMAKALQGSILLCRKAARYAVPSIRRRASALHHRRKCGVAALLGVFFTIARSGVDGGHRAHGCPHVVRCNAQSGGAGVR